MGYFILLLLFYGIAASFAKTKAKKRNKTKKIITYRAISSKSADTQWCDKGKSTEAQWYGKGQSVKVRGYNISDGLVYVGSKSAASNECENDAYLINPKLTVFATKSRQLNCKLGYWPRYGSITPNCRDTYLKWLSSGRCDQNIDVGYVFLFFYGLEHRLLVDGQNKSISEDERLDIVNEIRRLLNIYGNNNSFNHYARSLLAIEWALYQSDKPIPSYIDLGDGNCLPIKIVLAKCVVQGSPIPADLALKWGILRKEFEFRTPAWRCANEFAELFSIRYKQKFGDGLVVEGNDSCLYRKLKLEYNAANSVQFKSKELDLPDIFTLNAPLRKIGDLLGVCTDELERYSRFLGRKNVKLHYLAALKLLPKELAANPAFISRLQTHVSQSTGELQNIDDELVTVSSRDFEINYCIPKPGSGDNIVSQKLCLNEDLIRTREEENLLLADIFSSYEDAEICDNLSHSTLDKTHQSFLRKLLMQETWERADINIICKGLGLMCDGAMEVINEWAFDKINEQLICDNGAQICVNVNLARSIVNE